ncbi:HAD hydrolase-like protein (plasmid) [Rhizobium sp. CB3171]|uniref:HAD hydrolase-like protein n=1 Tax=unclassified Rhizobium TaxID=2613769 RepID=UPI000CDF4E7C|nr:MULTISPECIES: HAD hydrolase-like protein [Rhizobium]AVA26539.1 HAD superfamily hydrolase protein [Rhizobium sp. NXC24]UWU25370.1 HAD hydrolase-like protein [Rhizobium tropici]WFU06638.1 HAD hydrolase-like protein [Rhizobium sp. CB3171]
MSYAVSNLLLDLDGTLVDSQPGILSSCRAALRALDHETDPEMDIRSIIGPPIEDVMRYLLSSFGDDRTAEAVEAYRSDYGTRGLLLCELYPGIRETLVELHSRGVRLFLATSKRETFARRILDNHGLSDLFQGIYGSMPGTGLEHKPELLAHILRDTGLDAQDCLMVGDRKFDIVGAHANRMRAVGVLWGYGSREELELAGTDVIVGAPAELMSLARKAVSIL